MGRGKGRNIFTVGKTNSAQTFLLRPLVVLFDTFCTSSNSKYAWIVLDGIEVIFSNDPIESEMMVT